MPARGLWGYELEFERERDGEEETAIVQELLFGITPDFAVTVSVPYVRAHGLGDLELRAKWRFLRRDFAGGSDQLAVIGSLRAPTGDGSDRLGGLLAITGTHSFGNWYLWSDLQAGLRDPDQRYAADVAVGWRPYLAEFNEIDINPVLELNVIRPGEAPGVHQSDRLFLSPGMLIAYRQYLVKFGIQVPARDRAGDSSVNLTAAFEIHF